MPHFNRGMVFTNDKCIGCNRCISGCPIPSANVSVYQDGRNRIEVDENKCIHCGHCLSVCRHQAREYLDDTEAFFAALAAGEPVGLAVAPSFFLIYPQRSRQILGYLRSLGAGAIYDISFGADICTWAYLEYMDKYGGGLVSQTCPALLNYLQQYHPEVLPRLIPIHSPLMCLAVYAEKYLHDSRPLAMLSPCLAKGDEIASPRTPDNVRYNVTFGHLMQRLAGLDLSGYEAEPDLNGAFLGGIYPIGGGLRANLEMYLPPELGVLSMDNIVSPTRDIDAYERSFADAQVRPYLIDALYCDYGCVGGPGVCKDGSVMGVVAGSYQRLRREQEASRADAAGWRERRQALQAAFAGLRLADFQREFTDLQQKVEPLPPDELEQVFRAMHKLDEEARRIDCGSCGYASCRDMAYAIGRGYNQRENCVHYAKDETLRLYLTDDLTGIPNAVSFYRDTAQLLTDNPQTRYVVGIFDIKRFKVINDLYGFEEGNRCLRYIADKLARFVRDQGSCARLEADRFALCLPDSPALLDALLAASRRDCDSYDLDFSLSIDFGFCVVEDRSIPVSLLLDRARLAQAAIKGSYEIRSAVYDEQMRQHLLGEAELTAEMRGALNEGQFQIYLQPQYNHASGKLVGAEALVRWLHPRKGLISPAVFIPVFEKNGFITMLDRFVWEQACLVQRKWLDEGRQGLPLSVNLSRLDIYDPTLLTTLTSLLAKYRLPVSLLKLEITESAYVETPRQLIQAVRALQQAGFVIEMDDFGSGYSSLNTLKDVPVDILKLDLNFISGDNSGRGGNILQSVVRMARWLEIPVIAEGVESRLQADYLKSIGCEIVQGFYYSKPLPVPEFEKLLDDLPRGLAAEAGRMTSVTDLSEFWNPDGQATLLFNSFVGGAGILEYREGSLEALRVNDNYYREVGLSRAEYERIRPRLLERLLPEDRPRFLAMLEQAVASGKDAECDCRWRFHPDQPEDLTWLHIRVKLMATSSDRHILYEAVENITQKKKNELLVSASAATQRLAALLGPTDDVIFEFEYRSLNMISYYNFQHMFGRAPHTVDPLHTVVEAGLVHPDDVEEYRRIFRETAAGKPHNQAAFRLKNAEGHYQPCLATLSIIYSEQGEPVSVIGRIAALPEQKGA